MRRKVVWFSMGTTFAVVIAGLLIYGSIAGRQPVSAPTPTPTLADAEPTRSAVPPVSGKVVTPGRQPDSKTDGPRPELKPVQPDKAVEGQDGVRVALTSIESVTGKAVQPGEVGGPAIRVRVTMTNAGVRSLNAASSVVNCYYGANRKPAGALVEPGGVPLYGQLAPGKTTYGVYIFAVPVKQRGDVTITVDYRVEVPVVVFQGDVG